MKLRVEYNEPLDPYRWLTDYAADLNRISKRRWLGFPFYDLLAGAVVWTDEMRRPLRHTARRTPTEVIWALRSLWGYRTSLVLSQPREQLGEYWQFGLKHFPDWVGFHPKRRIATPRLLRICREGAARTDKLVDDVERLADA